MLPFCANSQAASSRICINQKWMMRKADSQEKVEYIYATNWCSSHTCSIRGVTYDVIVTFELGTTAGCRFAATGAGMSNTRRAAPASSWHSRPFSDFRSRLSTRYTLNKDILAFLERAKSKVRSRSSSKALLRRPSVNRRVTGPWLVT